MISLSNIAGMFQAAGPMAVWIVITCVAARRRHRGIAGAAALLACIACFRVLTFHNVAFWRAAGRLDAPTYQGWRELAVCRLSRDHFGAPGNVPYLMVGSSQVGAICGAAPDDIGTRLQAFSLAGMRPLDYLMHQRDILKRNPGAIVLYLSEFDLATCHTAEVAKTGPRQPWRDLAAQLLMFHRHFRNQPEIYRQQRPDLRDMIVGNAFPEYKYAFVFSGFTKKHLGIAEHSYEMPGTTQSSPLPSSPPLAPALSTARHARIQRTADHTESITDPQHTEINLEALQRFLEAMAERDVPVVILEGQVNPAAETPRLDAARPRIRAVLAALGRDDPNVSFVPAEELPNFTDADFTDFAHLTPGAGAAFADDLVSRILPAAIAKHRPLTP